MTDTELQQVIDRYRADLLEAMDRYHADMTECLRRYSRQAERNAGSADHK